MRKLFFLLSLIIVITFSMQGTYAQTRKSHGAKGAVIGGVQAQA